MALILSLMLLSALFFQTVQSVILCELFHVYINIHTFNEFFDSLGLHRVALRGCFMCFASTSFAVVRSVRFVPAVLLDQRDDELFGLFRWF